MTDCKPKKTPKPLLSWCVVLPGNQVVLARAHTRFEARARAKEQLGIPRKGRLPVGTKLSRVEGV